MSAPESRLQRGDTIHAAGTQDSRLHIWVVCSDCDASARDVVVVSITTMHDDQRQDTTCVLDVGDHEFIRHTSVVFYALAEVRSLAALNGALAARKMKKGAPMRPDVLDVIVRGFAASRETPPECEAILESQGHLRR